MSLRSTCRKVCLFLVGMNLFQPLRVALDGGKYVEGRFNFKPDDVGTFVVSANVRMTVLAGAGGILVALYLMLVSARLGISHINKLLAIVGNWLVLLFDLIVLGTFCAGGEQGSFHSFLSALVLSSLVFGANETLILNVDPVNIPFFLLGIATSAFQVLIYQIAFRRFSPQPLDPNLLTWTEREGYKIVVGQLVISALVSLAAAGLFTFAYGGPDLFNLIGIHKISHFLLDNSGNHLHGNYSWNRRYRRYLNEEIVHKIKNLEYEIMLKFALKSTYKITNIIQPSGRKRLNRFYRPRRATRPSVTGPVEREEAPEGSPPASPRASGRGSGRSSNPQDRVDITVDVRGLRYENMAEGLEIFRHEVSKDVKLTRIHNNLTDIDVNLYHFKYADVYSKSGLTLINVITVQFAASPEDQAPQGKPGRARPLGFLARLFGRRPRADDEDEADGGEAHSREEEDGVYEMNYYFLIVLDRMYQYKPLHDEWVHPVELLGKLIALHEHARAEEARGPTRWAPWALGGGKPPRGGRRRPKAGKDAADSERPEQEAKAGGGSDETLSEDADNRDKAADGGEELAVAEGKDTPKGGKHGPKDGKHTPKPDGDAEVALSDAEADALRAKLIVLFLNNKLRFAVRGTLAPLALVLLSTASLFAVKPLMGICDGLGPEASARFEVFARVAGLVPAGAVCVVAALFGGLAVQAPWQGAWRYFCGYLVLLVCCLAGFLVSRAGRSHTEHGLTTLLVVAALSHEANLVLALAGLPFQRSSRRDHLTRAPLDNNAKTSVQLLSFALLSYQAVRLLHLSLFRKAANRLLLHLFWTA